MVISQHDVILHHGVRPVASRGRRGLEPGLRTQSVRLLRHEQRFRERREDKGAPCGSHRSRSSGYGRTRNHGRAPDGMMIWWLGTYIFGAWIQVLQLYARQTQRTLAQALEVQRQRGYVDALEPSRTWTRFSRSSFDSSRPQTRAPAPQTGQSSRGFSTNTASRIKRRIVGPSRLHGRGKRATSILLAAGRATVKLCRTKAKAALLAGLSGADGAARTRPSTSRSP